MKRHALTAIAVGAAFALMTGCATTKVTRTGPEEVIDISGNWNDTDSRLTAEAMIKEALEGAWLGTFSHTHTQPPDVTVGRIVNRSDEHINTQTFILDLQRELTNSGKVNFVASMGERGEIREEKSDQAQYAAPETRKAQGQEIGADYILTGTINSIIDAASGEAVKYYQIDLKLTDIRNNRQVWFGQKKIKKLVERGRFAP